MNKNELRGKFRRIRDELSLETRIKWSADICNKIKNMPLFNESKVVAGYSTIGSEADIKEILLDVLEAGKVLVLPVCTDEGIVEFRRVNSLNKLKQGKYGILEPDSDIVIPYEHIDFMMVPGLVFDKNGHRIGYGKGYYDRVLAKTNKDCMTCGIAYSIQIVPFLETERFDLPVKVIISN